MHRLWVAAGLIWLTLLPPVGMAQIAPVAQARTSGNPSAVRLELHAAGDRRQFHLGEIVPLELTFTGEESKVFTIYNPECGGRRIYRARIEPALVDRLEEFDAALYVTGIDTCGHGGSVNLNPHDKPIHEQMDLNDWFRIDAPGVYHVSITSTRFSTTSNTIELEILPSDQAWEKSELGLATSLVALPKTVPEHYQGCRKLRFLETADAVSELAKRFARGDCADEFGTAFMNPKNRGAAAQSLEDALRAPDTPISPRFVTFLAYVSLYEQHPEWYPVWPRLNDSFAPFVPSQEQKITTSRLWTEREAVAAEELRIARLLLSALPEKNPAARSEVLKGLLFLDSTTGISRTIPMPPEIENAVREQLPDLFEKLPPLDQELVLRTGWLGVKGPAMIPVLKHVVETNSHNPPLGLALRRLYELSPAEGRPYILNELSSFTPRLSIDVLGILPDRELPELDRIELKGLINEIGHKESPGASAYIGRYASRAIENDLLELIAGHPTLAYESLGAGECESQANLLSYFLRVDPAKGKEMLHQAMSVPRKPLGCHTELFRRLPDSWTSPEIEEAAIAALDDPEFQVVKGALFVLRRDGTIKAKQPLSDHFLNWHDAWKDRAKELSQADQYTRDIDTAYFDTLTAAYGWIASPDEVRVFAGLCISQGCKDLARRRIESVNEDRVIGVSQLSWDNLTEKLSIGPYYDVIGSIDRLENKMSQYPMGTSFRLASQVRSDAAQRLYDALVPWAADHGFRIRPPDKSDAQGQLP